MQIKPFHESIIDVILLSNPTQLVIIAELLKRTKIPKKHIPSILKVWKQTTHDYKSLDYLVTAHLTKMLNEKTNQTP